jgi:hypothetical protein
MRGWTHVRYPHQVGIVRALSRSRRNGCPEDGGNGFQVGRHFSAARRADLPNQKGDTFTKTLIGVAQNAPMGPDRVPLELAPTRLRPGVTQLEAPATLPGLHANRPVPLQTLSAVRIR